MNRRGFLLSSLLLSAFPAWAAPDERFARGLLWRVSKKDVAPSHVFGTIHVADPRLAELRYGAWEGFTWKEIEVRGRPKPGVFLSGRTAQWAAKVGAGKIELSMTHSRELAAAVAVVIEAE